MVEISDLVVYAWQGPGLRAEIDHFLHSGVRSNAGWRALWCRGNAPHVTARQPTFSYPRIPEPIPDSASLNEICDRLCRRLFYSVQLLCVIAERTV
jgi:hypothetical protein